MGLPVRKYPTYIWVKGEGGEENKKQNTNLIRED
jgi:hypothetical protein